MTRRRPFAPLAALVLAAACPAQGALFLHKGDLVQAQPIDRDVQQALQRLCRGPSADERARGLDSAVPAGTELLELRRDGSALTLVLDAGIMLAVHKGSIEPAIEQLTKTAFDTGNAQGLGIRTVHLRVRAGTDERDLSSILGSGATASPTPSAAARTAGTTAAATANTPIGSSGGTNFGIASATATGALSGLRIAISPGHGYYWHSTLGWTTQRGFIDGTVEDLHTAEICNDFLIPMLANMGADVVLCREHGEIPTEAIADNDALAPSYVETGAWTTSTSSGFNGGGYRFAGSALTANATATWTVPVAQSGVHPVYVWFRAGTNRSTAARFTVQHTGGSTTIAVDQTIDDRTWVWLGDYAFDAATGATVTLDNQGITGVVIADAVRVGAGLGSIARGAGTSGGARWQECSRYWAQYAGAPSTVWDNTAGGEDNDDDVTTRPRFAEWRTADAYVSLHTNAGGGAGTSTYIHDTAPSAGSATLQARIHSQLISDIRAEYAAGWTDRGQLTANFGEVRLLSTMPGVLVELAFHDTVGSLDLNAIHDPRFRYLSGRAMARGVLRYFFPVAAFPPEAPTALRVTQDGARGLLVAWDAVGGATQYVVEISPDGNGFVTAATVNTTSWSTGPLPFDSVRSFRVRARNSSGQSMPTEVLTAGTDHLGVAQALFVQGFDRLSRTVPVRDNKKNYLARHAAAARRGEPFSLGFDAASNEAVRLGRVTLPNYRAVVWCSGEESTTDETFDTTEQNLVASYLNQGGRLFVSGAEIGWDLDAQGGVADKNFYHLVLGTSYLADDAGTYALQAGVAGSIYQGLPAGSFDNGTSGTYNVDFPDVIAPFDAQSTVCLRYATGATAGIQRIAGNARVVMLGFPLETVVSDSLRALLLQNALRFLLDPMPIEAPAAIHLGQRWQLQVETPADANLPYITAISYARAPGIPLPGGGLFPLQQTFLVDMSLDPSTPIFGNFLGTLDAQGRASPFVDVPPLSFLIGLPIYASGISLQAGGGLVVQSIWNWVGAPIGP